MVESATMFVVRSLAESSSYLLDVISIVKGNLVAFQAYTYHTDALLDDLQELVPTISDCMSTASVSLLLTDIADEYPFHRCICPAVSLG